jgi:hypothetical protein
VNLLKRLRDHKAVRAASFLTTLAIALFAAAIVVFLTADLGPIAKGYAEKYGSKYIDRPLHIGSLTIHLFSGKVAISDFRIDGLHQGDRPFFTAKQLLVQLDWRPAFSLLPDINVAAVQLTDWTMLVEKWPTEHNFPRLTRQDDSPRGPRRFTVTMKSFKGERGEFSYEDHEAPWSVVCRKLNLDITNVPEYHGTATFTDGMVTIQDNVPMWTKMKAQFVLDGPRVRLDRIDIDTDGATTVARGEVDLAHWPEQTYQVQSRVQFPRMREIFFRNERWPLAGEGQFAGTFHLFKDGRDLSGDFISDELGVYDYRFPQLYGSRTGPRSCSRSTTPAPGSWAAPRRSLIRSSRSDRRRGRPLASNSTPMGSMSRS